VFSGARFVKPYRQGDVKVMPRGMKRHVVTITSARADRRVAVWKDVRRVGRRIPARRLGISSRARAETAAVGEANDRVTNGSEPSNRAECQRR